MATALWGRDDTGIPVPGVKGRKLPKLPKQPKPAKQAKQPKASKAKPLTETWRVSSRISSKAIPTSSGRAKRIVLALFLAVAIAAGGFAAGALTEAGPVVEKYVLGDLSVPDPRIASLETELARSRAELATAETRTEELAEERKAIAKQRAAAEARVEELEAAVASKSESKSRSRSRSKSRDDEAKEEKAKKAESKSRSRSRSSRRR